MKQSAPPVAENAQCKVEVTDRPFPSTQEGDNVCRTRGRWIMGLPIIDDAISTEDMDRMAESATDASNFLKAISHEGRLMILCHLATGEKSVTELENLLSARQAAVSQQLSRLRLEGLVTPRREGKTIFYRLTDERPRQILDLVYDMFCRHG
jgi:ArsR family transcriptional regulator